MWECSCWKEVCARSCMEIIIPTQGHLQYSPCSLGMELPLWRQGRQTLKQPILWSWQRKSPLEWQSQYSSQRKLRETWTVMPGDHCEQGKCMWIFLSAFTAWLLKEVHPLWSPCRSICSFLFCLWNSLTNFNQPWARCRDSRDNYYPLTVMECQMKKML